MAMITSAKLDALRVEIITKYLEVLAQTPTWYQDLCTEVDSNSKANVYPLKMMETRLRQWVGPRVAQNLSEHDYTLKNIPFEATVELSKWDIMDDIIGTFMSMVIPDLAHAAKKHPDQLLAALLASNSALGPVGFDGVSFFNDAHPTYQDGGGTYDNNFAVALDAAGFTTVYAAMTSIIGANGDPMQVMPQTLIVPPQLAVTANTLANSAFYPSVNATSVVDNPFKGLISKVIVIPELAARATTWYLADLSQGIKPFIYQKRDPFNIVARDNPQDPKVFDQAVFTYGVDGRDNMGVAFPWLISKSVG